MRSPSICSFSLLILAALSYGVAQPYKSPNVGARLRAPGAPFVRSQFFSGVRYPRKPMMAPTGPFLDLLSWNMKERQDRVRNDETVEQGSVFVEDLQGDKKEEGGLDLNDGDLLEHSFVEPSDNEITQHTANFLRPRVAMLRDRPERSCSGSLQCRRKVDYSLDLLMRMMDAGR